MTLRLRSQTLKIVVLLSFSIHFCFGQKGIDSLENWIKTYPQKDTLWVANLLQLERLYYIHAPHNIGRFGAEILSTSQRLNYQRGITAGYSILAHQNIYKGRYSEAIKIVFKKVKYDEANKKESELANSYSLLGYIYTLMGKPEESIKYYTQTLTYSKKLPLTNPERNRLIVGDISNLVIAYNQIQEYNKSIKLLLEAYKMIELIKKKDNEYFYLKTTVLLNIGNTYSFLNKFDMANKYLIEGLNLMKEHHITIQAAQSYLSLCRNYIGLKQYERAKEVLVVLEKMQESKSLNADEISAYFSYWEEVEVAQQHFKSAYYIQKEGAAYSDSLKNKELYKELQELSVKYETQEKENKIAQLQHEKELGSTRNKLYIGLVLMLLFLLLIALFSIYQVRKAKRKADAANLLQEKLFSIIAHDLRTPVNNLKKATSTTKYVLLNKSVNEVEQLADKITQSASTLSNILENLLHWSLLQKGKLGVNFTQFVLSYEVKEVMEGMWGMAREKGIALTFDCLEDTQVNADRRVVQIILRNLIDNAIKFTPAGGKLSLVQTTNEKQVELRVNDTGIGIPQEMANVLFNANEKNKQRKGTADEEGSGIGLYLCKELARINGGDLKLEKSVVNEGSTFVLELKR